MLCFMLGLSSVTFAGKLYVTLANSLEEGTFDSFEISASSGGNYATSLDAGGTYYFNQKPQQDSLHLLSLDLFSSLENVQEYNVLFAAGIRLFGINVDPEPESDDDNNVGYGLMTGVDIGYRFPTTIPTVLLLSVDFSPDIITGGDIDDVFISNLLYEIMFTPIVITHISYRYGEVSFPHPDVPQATNKFENSVGFGLKIRF